MATKGNRLEQVRQRRQQERPREVANWGDVDGATISNAIASMAACGGAIRFGYTRDGGAYAVGLYFGDSHRTEYIRPSEGIEQYLIDLAEDMWAEWRSQQPNE